MKETVQPEIGSLHPRTLMDMLGGNPSINMSGFDSIFQAVENNYMVEESLEEYELAFLEAFN